MTKNFNAMTAWWDTAHALNSAALTIGMRNVEMAEQLRRGEVVPSADNINMVSEKVAAVSDGMLAASSMWMRLAMTPTSIPYDVGPALTMAFMKPGYKTANANAKRLSRRKRD